MYRQSYVKTDPIQTIQFTSLRKNPQILTSRIEQDTLLIPTQPNAILILLAGFSLITQQISSVDAQFSEFNFQQVPKSFQQYQHQKTISQIFTIIKTKIKSIENLCEFLNYYPVSVFVLECWTRQKSKAWIEASNRSEIMGNQQELLNDLSIQLRGPLLGMIASCFGVLLRIKYDLPPSHLDEIDDQVEEYGEVNSRFELIIEYRSDGITTGKFAEREIQNSVSMPNSKSSECGYLKRSKVVDNEVQSRSGAEFKSAKKERGGFCEKCGASKKCECNTIKRKGVGITPKSNQLSNSTNISYKNDPFNLGFLNANNISKIRDVNRK